MNLYLLFTVVFARLYCFKTRFCVEYIFCSNYKSILISVLVVNVQSFQEWKTIYFLQIDNSSSTYLYGL